MAGREREHFHELTGVRALMALWVVGGHTLQQAGFAASDLVWPVSVVRNAGYPVLVFIMLSGFVISHLVKTAREPYVTYIIRRFFRLAPLLFACILFLVGWSLFDVKTFRWDITRVDDYLLAYGTLSHGLVPWEYLPRASIAILPPAWSISLEWQFYLIAPLLILAWQPIRYPLFSALAVASMLATPAALKQWTGLTLSEAALPVSLFYFLIGIVSYDIFDAVRGRLIVRSAPAVTFCILLFCLSHNYALAIWAVVMAGLCGPNTISRFLANRILVWLGTISFSIYLVHMILIMPVRKTLGQSLMQLEFSSWSLFALTILTTVPATIAISALTYKFIELPGIRLGKRLTDQRNASSPVATTV